MLSQLRQLTFLGLILLWAWFGNFMLGYVFGPFWACVKRGDYCFETMQSYYDYIHANNLDLLVIGGYIFSTWLLWQIYKRMPTVDEISKA